MSAPERPVLTRMQAMSVTRAREVLAASQAEMDPYNYAHHSGALEVVLEQVLTVLGELTGETSAQDDAGRAIVADLDEHDPTGAGDEDEPCAAGCGYVSHGQDLIDHMRYEHTRCTECGNEPLGVHGVSHKHYCPRLQPGYTYPAEDDASRAIAAAGTDARMVAAVRAILAEFDWERDDRQYALEAIEQIVDGGQP